MRLRNVGLNPRFDGAFLNSTEKTVVAQYTGLNPRFDGAFLNSTILFFDSLLLSLNPRFDGAFLNSNSSSSMVSGYKS